MIWLHPDCLAVECPAIAKYPGEPALFVFDEEEIAAEQWTLKRIAFLYETLLQLPVDVERGNVVTKLLERKPTRIVTVDSVNPRFHEHVRMLRQSVDVETLPSIAFVNCAGTLDLKRFSRYWKRVEPFAFDP